MHLDKKIAILFAVIAVLVIGGGILIWKARQEAPSTELPEAKQSEKIEDETANWKSYESAEAGFKIKYPNDWEAGTDKNARVIDPLSGKILVETTAIGPPGFAENGVVNITVFTGTTLEKEVVRYEKEATKATFVRGGDVEINRSSVVINGHTGIKIIKKEMFKDVDGTLRPVQQIYILLEKDGKIFYLWGLIVVDDLSETLKVNQVFSAFRFLE